MEYFQALRELRCLSEVSDAGVEWLASKVIEEEHDVGAVLIQEGSSDRDCYFIVSGDTEVTQNGAVLGVSGAGEPEGEMAMFFRRPRGATTTVTSPVTALLLRAEDWDALEAQSPDAANHIRSGILQHLGRRFAAAPPPR